jgi:hypothetical protein
LGVVFLKEICHQALDIVVALQIDKRVVTMALLHIDQIKHFDVIALFLKEVAGIPQKLTLPAHSVKIVNGEN